MRDFVVFSTYRRNGRRLSLWRNDGYIIKQRLGR
jgi:hypothetical protein